MGSYVSSRWQGYNRKQTVDETPQLSIKTLIRRFGVQSFTQQTGSIPVTLSWSRQRRMNQVTAVFMNPDGLAPQMRLLYFANEKEQRQLVRFTSTPVHFGGVRWWFVCPHCTRRCGSLHIAAPLLVFACRMCHDLSYTSAQTAHQHDRGRFGELGRLILLERRYDKIRSRMSKHARWAKAYKRGLLQLAKIERELNELADIL